MLHEVSKEAETFVSLLMKHRDQLFMMIVALVGNEVDANDILQEVSLALFRKFDEYDRSRPFLAWASRFAQLEVLKFRSQTRRRPLSLSQETLDMLAGEWNAQEGQGDKEKDALETCISRLPAKDRAILRQRYFSSNITEVSLQVLGISRRSYFRDLERIRRVLSHCVQRYFASNGECHGHL